MSEIQNELFNVLCPLILHVKMSRLWRLDGKKISLGLPKYLFFLAAINYDYILRIIILIFGFKI